jgi:pimeloyl-ACP methyl ester carboxylesterase
MNVNAAWPRNIARGLALVLGCASLVLLSSCMALPGSRSIDVGDAHIQYSVRGNGPPVVFESGLGDGMDVWAKVIPEVSTFATALAYNRAGYGASSRSDSIRDGAHIVAELRALLQHSGLRPPYILVGHSLGGTYLELYARLHPDEVAGLVLVESRAASMTRQCRAAKLLACDPPQWLVSAMGGAASAEYKASDATFEQLGNAPSLPAVPLVVLTSTRPRLVEGPTWTNLWQATQKELALQSPLGEQRKTWLSGHYIQKDQPQLVIEAIRTVVARSQGAR